MTDDERELHEISMAEIADMILVIANRYIWFAFAVGFVLGLWLGVML